MAAAGREGHLVRRRGCLAVIAVLVLVLSGAAAWLFSSLRGDVPPDVEGVVVYVSNRSGTDSLWIRRLPRGAPRQITHNTTPLEDPALSPDATQVAYGERGRIGIVTIATGVVRQVTLGVDHEDRSPAWRADGRALVVATVRRVTGQSSLDILDLDTPDPEKLRTPLTGGMAAEEQTPVFSPQGDSVVFVREETLHRVSLLDGTTTRITGGFRTWRAPRFLASGRLVAQWTLGKAFGIDEMDADGKNAATLWTGRIRFRGVSPSPDGRFLAASFGYDLQFHLAETVGLRHDGDIQLRSRDGLFLARLAGGLREKAHSPDWGPRATSGS